MTVRVTMERRVIPGREIELNNLLLELRARAVTQGGYIHGETVVDAYQPGFFLVIGTWYTLRDWEAWEFSPRRQEIIKEIDALLMESAGTRVWMEESGVPVAAV